tara:strand:+ start:2244 stop:2453 length:210 start_codon:yes stop_codon:yes gene_type:complete
MKQSNGCLTSLDNARLVAASSSLKPNGSARKLGTEKMRLNVLRLLFHKPYTPISHAEKAGQQEIPYSDD